MTTTDDRTHGGVFPDVDRVDQVIRQMPVVGFGAHYVDAVRAARDALAALSSPPADDVREVLARAIWDCDDLERAVLEDCRGMADAILSRFEVRLRGTVTDAEVEAALNGWLGLSGDVVQAESAVLWRRRNASHMRAALEAARGARVSAENTTPTNHETRRL